MSSESPRIRVLLVDDHSIMRDGLRVMLEQSQDFEVVGQSRDGVEAVRAAAELSPDVVVMDVMMPNMDGVDACREIMGSLPDTRVVMLTASTEEDAVTEAVAAGATGYLQKVSGMDRLLSTIKVVAAGDMRLPTEVVRRVFALIRTGAQPEKEQPDLTPREREILTSFSQGMSYAEIAAARGVQPVTIRNAVYGIQDKLRLRTKQEIVVWAVRNGLLDD
ncbi:MAG: response regulator transcription factor [Chloroflexi bacterium]|nr:response regulator transcription factor [Chloroflexota bacterium]MCY3894889.1 response regulator transcription factor [Chloroflexota bacterium]